MSSYICPRCGFETTRKLNFKRHLFRKRQCDPINSNISIKSIAESYGMENTSTENLGVIRELSGSGYPEGLSGPDNKIEHRCKFCNKSFKHKSNKSRHEKSRCKKRMNINNLNNINFENKTNKTNKTIYTQEEVERKLKEAKKESDRKIKEVEDKYEVLADKKAQKMVLSIVDKLIPKQTTNQTTNQDSPLARRSRT